MADLSPLMVDVLRALAASDRPMTGNDIGDAVSASRVVGGRGMNGRGKGHRVFGSAQRVIPAITALRNRGLITLSWRPDGRSGSADVITEAGREALRQIDSDGPDGKRDADAC